MHNHLSDPWSFDNEFISPDNVHRLFYYGLQEVSEGAPLGGICEWINAEGSKRRFWRLCAGPPQWQKEGKFVAIPVWTDRILSGKRQRIALLNTENATLTVFRRIYRVCHLHLFEDKILSGIDSPLHKPKRIEIDIRKEEVKEIRQL